MNAPTLSRRRLATALAGALLFTAATAAGNIDNSGEARLRDEMHVVLLRLIESGAFGSTAPQDISLRLDEPAQRVTNIGLLVDSATAEHARDGLHVLGTTPGSTAQRMGVQAGDVLLAVNGQSLRELGADANGHALAAQQLRTAVDALKDGDRLALSVARAGKTLELTSAVASVYLPPLHLALGNAALLAANGDAGMAGALAPPAAADPSSCGRISTFDVAPRQKNLYAAKLLSIDGKLAGVSRQNNYRVSAGEHRLELSENIDYRQLSFNDRARNAANVGTKTITVNVAPDTTYLVAARLNPDRASVAANGAYWDPVVWKEMPEACR